MTLASLADWGAAAGIVSASAAVIGLAFVALQLEKATATARAQATIQFQQAFRDSRQVRGQVQRRFPLHANLLEHVVGDPPEGLVTWTDELPQDYRSEANAVIGALNDVAQYVADGLSLRSALQQYHSIFVRVGALLIPYIEHRNAPYLDAEGQERRPTRFGLRVVVLYNAAIAYHLASEKHKDTTLKLDMRGDEGFPRVELVLLDPSGRLPSVERCHTFEDHYKPPLWLPSTGDPLSDVIREAERQLRS